MELHDYIAARLDVHDIRQIECIKNILAETVVLNEYRTGTMSEKKLDMLVKVTGSYLKEILDLFTSPDQYEEKLLQVKAQMESIA